MKQLKGKLYEDEDARAEAWQKVREEVKRAALCTDYLDKAKSNTYICPFCHSGEGPKGTGLHYYPKTNTVGCFAGCKPPDKKSKRYDVIDLYRARYGVDTATAIKELARLHNIPLPGELENGPKKAAALPVREKPELVQKTPETAQNDAQDAPKKDFTDYFRQCAARLRDPAALAYLEKRGLSEDAAELLDIGFDPEADPGNKPGAAPGEWKPHPAPRIITPQGKYCFVGRRTDGKDEYKKINAKGGEADISGLDKILHNDIEIYYNPDFIAIGEGAFSVLSIVEASYFTCWPISLNSTGNAAQLVEQLEKNKDKLPQYANGNIYDFLICTDNDDAGHSAAEYLEKELDRLGLHCIADFLGAEPGEDPNDLLLRIGADELNKRIDAARERLAKKYENPTTPANIPNPFSLSAEDSAETPEEDTSAADPDAAQTEEAGKAGEETPPEPKKDKLQAFFEKIQTEAYKPHETGLRFFDDLLGGGVMQQSLLIIMAAPGSGKTTLAQQIAEEMADRGTGLVYLNFEMSYEQMIAKALSYRLAKEGRRLTSDEILKGYGWTDTPRERVKRAYEEYREGPAKHIDYESGVKPTLDILQAYLTKTGEAAKKANEPAPAIVADYLQLITGEGDNEAKTVKAAITMLKDYAIKYNTFVICIAAINRESAKAGRITLESARDSSGVEYTGDYVISLQYYDIDQEIADGRKPGVLSALQLEPWRRLIIRVLKHRLGGGVGKSAKVYYNAAYNYFVGEKQSLPNWPERDLKSRNPFAPGAAGAAAPDIQEEDEPRNEWQQADFSDISAAF